MITNSLSELMGRKRLRIVDVARGANVSRNAVTALYYDRAKGIEFHTMDRLCSFLEAQPGDLFGYVVEEEDE